MRFPALIFLALGAATTMAACKKDKDPVTETTPPHIPDFEYSGTLYVYQPVLFKSNFSEGTQLTWKFGDGQEENIFGTQPTHMYTEAGTYYVNMAVVDSFGGSASKAITITNGPERVDGNHNWNFLLKAGRNLAVIPTISFSGEMELEIVDDTTIRIPDIPQLRVRGPYTVYKYEVNAEHLVYRSADWQTEVSYNFADQIAGMKIVQVHKDTTWTLTGGASIFN